MDHQVKQEDCSDLANHRKDEKYESEDVSLSKNILEVQRGQRTGRDLKTYQRTEWRREKSARARERRLEVA